MKVAYFGPKGTFCQEAMEKYIEVNSLVDVERIDYPNIMDVLTAVVEKKVDLAIVPIENSIEGTINVTLDILSQTHELYITGEVVLNIEHCLLGKKETKMEEIELILSYPPALAQCNKYLKTNYPNVKTSLSLSTADGAKSSSLSNGKTVAIGNINAAKVYGLEVLKKGIQDEKNNETRFVAVSLNLRENTGNDKTSLIFSSENKPGSLYKILDIFNLWDINLTKIESRPARNQLGKYIFFVDIEGHVDDPDIKDALSIVNRKTSYLRILGSYPLFKKLRGEDSDK